MSSAREATAFRLTLVLGVALWLGFSAGALYFDQRVAQREFALKTRAGFIMDASSGPAWRDIAQIVIARDSDENAARIARLMAFVAPCVALAGFYAIRWGITGRVRPLVPR